MRIKAGTVGTDTRSDYTNVRHNRVVLHSQIGPSTKQTTGRRCVTISCVASFV